jgi:hypothetical protein
MEPKRQTLQEKSILISKKDSFELKLYLLKILLNLMESKVQKLKGNGDLKDQITKLKTAI